MATLRKDLNVLNFRELIFATGDIPTNYFHKNRFIKQISKNKLIPSLCADFSAVEERKKRTET